MKTQSTSAIRPGRTSAGAGGLRRRTSHWQPSLYALALLAACAQSPASPDPDKTVTTIDQVAPGVPPARIDPCACGPLDVVFVIDDTGSMGTSLANFQSNFSQLLVQIQQSSSGDYRLGLVTFKDTVTVLNDLSAGNDASVSANIAGLVASGGNNEPEASDEALNTVLNNLPARPGQTGNFSGYWRTGARRFVVLLTDARPAGFDDNYVAGTDDVQAHAQAVTAATLGIKLHAVYVTHGAPNPTIASVMQDYAITSQGLYRETQPNGTDAYLAVRDFLSGCRTASDVWMQDHPSDVGQEPHGLNPIYYSPDIKVCNSASGCVAPGTNPVYGSPGLNHVFVTLRNDGPNVSPPGPASGSLYVYYTSAGGNALWGGTDWTLIGVQPGVFMTPGEHREVRIPWNNVPAPGHYCLLARWVSAGDPMTFPELIGSNTLTNTRNNNNIAWRNVDVIRTTPGHPTHGTFTWTDRPGGLATLAIAPVTTLPGTAVLDLGGLFDGWRRNGSKGSGFTVIGATQLLIAPQGGMVVDVPAPAQGRATVGLNFTVQTPGTWPVRVRQISRETGEELGGVEYQLVVVRPDEPATAPTVAAVGDSKGVKLSWTHDAQHIHYAIWRSTQPNFQPGEGAVVAEMDAAGADVTSALTFTDPASAGTAFYYRVESRSSSSGAFSDVATASAGTNTGK
jgi:hypothetical protein